MGTSGASGMLETTHEEWADGGDHQGHVSSAGQTMAPEEKSLTLVEWDGALGNPKGAP